MKKFLINLLILVCMLLLYVLIDYLTNGFISTGFLRYVFFIVFISGGVLLSNLYSQRTNID